MLITGLEIVKQTAHLEHTELMQLQLIPFPLVSKNVLLTHLLEIQTGYVYRTVEQVCMEIL
jgi:hypothetical protein